MVAGNCSIACADSRTPERSGYRRKYCDKSTSAKGIESFMKLTRMRYDEHGDMRSSFAAAMAISKKSTGGLANTLEEWMAPVIATFSSNSKDWGLPLLPKKNVRIRIPTARKPDCAQESRKSMYVSQHNERAPKTPSGRPTPSWHRRHTSSISSPGQRDITSSPLSPLDPRSTEKDPSSVHDVDKIQNDEESSVQVIEEVG